MEQEVAKHVEDLTRIKPYGKITAEESLNLLIKQQRYNTALIKFFDRVHNIQTLGAKSPEKICIKDCDKANNQNINNLNFIRINGYIL